MKKAKVFVPGKVLISGEHAVVYGYPAIAAAIDRGVTVEITSNNGEVVVDSNEKDELGLVGKALELVGANSQGITVRIRSNLPVGSGLGSSAAVSAAVIKAVTEYLGKEISDEEWFELTMECERVAHGNPSGVDPAVVINGGLVRYAKDDGVKRFSLPKPYTFILVQSGAPIESTKDMVVGVVGEAYKNRREEVEAILKSIQTATSNLQDRMLVSGDIRELINENGRLLEELGVVGEKAKDLGRELRQLGSGVKITGAGGLQDGSGMVLVYNSDLSKVEPYLAEKKWEHFLVSVGGRSK